MRVVVALVALALSFAACASPSKVKVETKTVLVPVATKCATDVPPVQQYAADLVDLGSDIYELMRALLIDREQRKATEAELRAAVDGCK